MGVDPIKAGNEKFMSILLLVACHVLCVLPHGLQERYWGKWFPCTPEKLAEYLICFTTQTHSIHKGAATAVLLAVSIP